MRMVVLYLKGGGARVSGREKRRGGARLRVHALGLRDAEVVGVDVHELELEV
jgi:hypothetical protein